MTEETGKNGIYLEIVLLSDQRLYTDLPNDEIKESEIE